VFVIVQPPEPSCLHTAYSVGLVFDEKDSLVSRSRYPLYIGKLCVLMGSSEEPRKRERLAVWVLGRALPQLGGGMCGWVSCPQKYRCQVCSADFTWTC